MKIRKMVTIYHLTAFFFFIARFHIASRLKSKKSCLLKLPNEILYEILDYVLPDDLVNFSTTCSHIHLLATRALYEHRDLQRKYYNFHWNYEHDEKDRDNFERLHDLLRNPRIAFYVKSFQVCDSGPGFIEDGIFKFSKRDTDLLENAIKQHFYSETDKRKDYVERVQNRDMESISALLIMMLPNLEKIEIDMELEMREEFSDAMQQMTSFSTRNPRPLSRLKEIRFELEPLWDRNKYLESLAPFLTLPSLTFLSCSEISKRSVPTHVPQCVNITTLEINGCSLDEKQFFEFLKHFKNLRELNFQTQDNTLDPFWVSGTLYAHTRGTLEKLYLSLKGDGLSESHSATGGFHGFDKLKEVDIDLYCLFTKLDCDHKSIARLFPESVERITLRDIKFCKDDYVYIRDNLFTGSTLSLPNLQEIVLSGSHKLVSYPDREVIFKIDELKKKCERIGGFFGLATVRRLAFNGHHKVTITLKVLT